MKRIIRLAGLMLAITVLAGCQLDNEGMQYMIDQCQEDVECEQIVQDEFDRRLSESEIIKNINARLEVLEMEIQAQADLGTQILRDLNEIVILQGAGDLYDIYGNNYATEGYLYIELLINYTMFLEEDVNLTYGTLDKELISSVESGYKVFEKDILEYLESLNVDLEFRIYRVEYRGYFPEDDVKTEIKIIKAK